MALINAFMSLIYPRFCEACGRHLFQHEKYICHVCYLNLPKSAFHLNKQNAISLTLAGRVPLEEVLCLYLFEKKGRVQHLLHAIKYQNQKELAVYLGKLLARDYLLHDNLSSFDLILPIPLHKNKFKKRGYNQSELFAQGLSKGLGSLMIPDALIRTADSATQTRKKKFERWENVEGIFSVNSLEQLRNKHILLVDDVITTGATIDSAWQCLKEIEGLKISVACIAYARKT